MCSFPSTHSLGAVNPDAYQAFQTSRDLHAVLSKVVEIGDEHSSSSKKSALKITASVMTPILPMLVRLKPLFKFLLPTYA